MNTIVHLVLSTPNIFSNYLNLSILSIMIGKIIVSKK